ncbi:cyclic AMP-dependent transcription factor ATF-4-like [Seriola lalandi dorsalis]|uniref:Cyclic AMP-dependent transcription factor ATF-4 n=2 Tax=Seriola lalandi dorsalis TaxID=1841481 RepID=A0A3B4YTZ9_SERLL|nr:cyclic AMP-dependent transcription factor ATF-4-like [Seriola lalandi dorsalis]
MTMMMTNSQFGLEDMEALLWGPSSPMADPMGSLQFHPDQEEHQEGGGTSREGDTSPASPLTSSSLSSSSSPPPFYSPPPSPPAVLLHGDKARNESDLLSLPWLGHPDELRCSQTLSGDRKEEALGDLDWMAERMDLSEFDLESLIGSCSPPEESPSSTEDLLASLDCPMELDSLPLPTLSTPALSSLPFASLQSTPPSPPPLPAAGEDASVITVDDCESHADGQEAPSPPPCVPEPQEELEIKSEPSSPDPSSPWVESSSSPVYTLDLGSEVDVSESEVKPVLAAVVPQVPRLVLSLSPTRIVLVLAPKNEVGITTATVATTSEVIPSSPPAPSLQRSSRSRPYPEPKCKASPPSPSATSVKVKSLRGAAGDNRVTLKAPKDKKLKKMEQNKTAATRYRQKKRAEQDALTTEYALLERKNVELTEKAESIAREIEYLKELMDEVHLARMKKGLGADP